MPYIVRISDLAFHVFISYKIQINCTYIMIEWRNKNKRVDPIIYLDAEKAIYIYIYIYIYI
jgi:hypothetical protein